MLCRLTGEVKHVREQTWTKKDTGETGRMTFMRILVADQDMVEIAVPKDSPAPAVGSGVDLLIDVSVRNGYLRSYVQGVWQPEHDLVLA